MIPLTLTRTIRSRETCSNIKREKHEQLWQEVESRKPANQNEACPETYDELAMMFLGNPGVGER